MTASLMAGVILAVAMVSAIPVYTQGILGRLLLRDLQQYQEKSGNYPGVTSIRGFITPGDDAGVGEVFDRYTQQFDREIGRVLAPPVQSRAFRLQQNTLRVRRAGDPEDDPVPILLASVSGFLQRVSPVVGRLPEEVSEEDLIEVVITEEMAATARLAFGHEYRLYDRSLDAALPLRIHVVGIVEMTDTSDVYWSHSISKYAATAVGVDGEIRSKLFAQTRPPYAESEWAYTFDYQTLNVHDAEPLLAYVNQTRNVLRRQGLAVSLPIASILEEYLRREAALRIMLWVLQVPLLLMLGFYLVMVSQILVEHERNEIAIIKSRGGTTGQVFLSYVLLAVILAAVGVATGPFLGLTICRVLGASNGFLEFVQRRVLEVALSARAYLFAGLASVAAVTAVLIPTIASSRSTIVAHKQRLAAGLQGSRWQQAVVGFALVAFGVYGLYRYNTRNQLLALSGLEALEVTLDPVLLFVSTLFAVGLGMLILQVYPLLIRLLYRIGKGVWPPVLYAPLVQVSRGSGRDRFLMLFLILSISIGVYNADAARTLNQNTEDRVRYAVGADLVVQERWTRLPGPGQSSPGPGIGPAEPPTGPYVEPTFDRFARIEGVQAATKVLRTQDAGASPVNGEAFVVNEVLAVIPDEFGRIAWYRSDLLPSHWYHYLNALASDPQAALVSRSLMESHDLELGDEFYLRWNRQAAMLLRIYGFIDYWPTFNPFEGGPQTLVVANFNFVELMIAAEPYEVWMLLDPTVPTSTVYESMREARINSQRVENPRQQLVAARNDAQLQGINGSLTLGFLLSLAVCFGGFVIYWVFSIGERTLQFGLFRAMGLGRAAIVAMLAIEQLLISGAAVAFGFVVGRVTSLLFVPLLQTVRDSADTVPPFRVVSWPLDHLRIAAVVAAMLLLGFGVLAWFIARIRIHQAVKLGEE